MDDRRTVENFMREKSFTMLKRGTGVFRHPFIDPGAGYEDNLWDWDSHFSSVALMDICDYFCLPSDARRRVSEHTRGYIRNFFDYMENDGFVPMAVTATGLFSDYLVRLHRAGKPVNQHKPFLCQSVLAVSDFDGEIDWCDFDKLRKYLGFYEKNQWDCNSGLFFWRNDVMIGMDNNPTVFGRPENSVADIYLNSFMYREYSAMAKLCRKTGRSGEEYDARAEKLKAAMNVLFDRHSGLYYSADLLSHTRRDEVFHHNLGVFWKTMPLKIRMWACFLPMYCGISTPEQDRMMIERHYLDPHFLSPYGVRTVADDESMYNTECSSNPSNWLGPIWIVANYCVFKGLLRAGRTDLASDLCDRTVKLLAADIKKNNAMSESYVPESGAPMMYGGFLNWNCLAVSMLKELKEKEGRK